MYILLATIIGVMFAASLYLMMRRSLVRLILGLALLSHAANLLIFTTGGLVRAQPPIMTEGQILSSPPAADPLPQALILTAIVINFGVLAFALVLVYRVYQLTGTEDIDEIREPEI